MTKLHEVSGTEHPDRAGDVVFVHGLDGDAVATWRSGKDLDTFWPRWLGEDVPQVGVWSLDYDAHSIAWKGSAMPLSDRATNVLALMDAHGLGRRPLAFVTHSLGGLLVKQLLRHAIDYGEPEWKAVADNTRGIVFLATPHSGSNIANWLQYASLVLRTNATIEDLRAHDAHLRNLNLWFRSNAMKMNVKCQVYFEKEKLSNLIVVDETSADPGIPGVIPVPLDANHLDICKPATRSDIVYTRTKAFITKCFGTRVDVGEKIALNEYLYIDYRRLEHYCGASEARLEDKFLRVFQEAERETNLQKFGACRVIARCAILPRTKASTSSVSPVSTQRLWLSSDICLVEHPEPIEDESLGHFSTGYSSLLLRLAEELDVQISDAAPANGSPTQYTRCDVDPVVFSQLKSGQREMALQTAFSAASMSLDDDVDIGRCSSSDDHWWLEIKSGSRRYDVTLRKSDISRLPTVEIRRDSAKEMDDAFKRNPTDVLLRLGAKILSPREIDTLFLIRDSDSGGTIGYPIMIAAAPSTFSNFTSSRRG